MLELSLRIEKKFNICMNIFRVSFVKLILYDHRKYEPFQTKAFIEQKLINFNPALINIYIVVGPTGISHLALLRYIYIYIYIYI